MKFALAIIWTAFIGFLFYKEQSYYLPILLRAKEWIPFVVIFFIVHFSAKKLFTSKNSHDGNRLKLRWLIILSFIFATLLSSVKFYQYDLSRLTEKNIIKSGDELILTEEEPAFGQEILFSKDEIVSQSSIVKSYLPPTVSKYFKDLSPLLLFVLLGKIILSAAVILLLIFIFASLGSILTEDLLLASGLGMLFLSLLSFGMAAAGIFSIEWILAFLLIALASSFPFWKKFWRQKNIGKFEFNINFTTTAFFLGMAMVDIIKVFPFGWDNLNVYSRYEKILAESGNFPHGIGSFAWTNLASAGWLFTENIYLSTLMLFTSSILGFALLIRILRRFHSEKVSWLLAIIFYTLPFVVNQQFVDMKSDMPLFFIGCLAVERFLEYMEKRDKKNLLLIGLLLGFAFAIKITSFILIVTLIFALIFHHQKKWFLPVGLTFLLLSILGYTNNFAGLNKLPTKEISTIFAIIGILLSGISIYQNRAKKILGELIILCGTIFIIFSPWGIYNFIDSGARYPISMFFGKTEAQPQMLELIEYCKTPYEVVDLDYDRYTGGIKDIKDFVSIPWKVNFTSDFDNPIADFSFIFLAAAGFFVLFPKKLLRSVYGAVALFTGIYILIWCFVGNGVIWYGIFAFLGLLILLGNIPNKLLEEENKSRKFIISGITIIVIFSNFLIRYDKFAPSQFFVNSIGAISNETLQEYIFPGYKEVAILINGADQSKVQLYRVGTFIPYFIDLTDSQIRSDHFLEDWKCIQSENDDTIKNIFKANGFSHILINESFDTRIENANYSDAQMKFMEFLNRSGWNVLYKKHGLRLVEII